MSDQQPSDRRLEEAMDWLLRLQDTPDDAGLRHAVEAWVAADPDNRRAWNQARRAWQAMGDLPPATASDWEKPGGSGQVVQLPLSRSAVDAGTKRSTAKARRGRRGLIVAALAAAACLALIFGPSLTLHLQADHVTAVAETRQVTLPDGSLAHLAPESAIELNFTDGRRSLVLLEGTAFFDVKADPQRPFAVGADAVQIEVIGTAFGVALSADAVEVEVESGTVDTRSVADLPPIDQRLSRGQTLRVDRETGTVLLGQRPPDDMAAWRHGRLLVVDASIAEVVERLRPYHAGWILLVDEDLAAKRVNGIYDLSNPDSALRALVLPAGGQVEEITPLLRVLR